MLHNYLFASIQDDKIGKGNEIYFGIFISCYGFWNICLGGEGFNELNRATHKAYFLKKNVHLPILLL